MVRDRPFFLLFDLVDDDAGFDRRTICDGGGGGGSGGGGGGGSGGGRGSSNADCATDGGDTRLGGW
jgi:hypothetical protein